MRFATYNMLHITYVIYYICKNLRFSVKLYQILRFARNFKELSKFYFTFFFNFLIFRNQVFRDFQDFSKNQSFEIFKKFC